MKKGFAILFSVLSFSVCFAQNKDKISKDTCKITIPNTLSVNAEGRNDFRVRCDCMVSDLQLKIYDRWGVEIYKTGRFDVDGYVDWKWRELKNAGTYYWIVSYYEMDAGNKEKQSATGFVTVIK